MLVCIVYVRMAISTHGCPGASTSCVTLKKVTGSRIVTSVGTAISMDVTSPGLLISNVEPLRCS